MFTDQPYYPTNGATSTKCPGLLERLFPENEPYLPSSPPAAVRPRLMGPDPAPVGRVTVPIGSPEMHGDTSIARGASVCIAVPPGATRYTVSIAVMSPGSGSSCAKEDLPHAIAFALDQPESGELGADVTQLLLTPIWARLNDEKVAVNSVRSKLHVDFA